MNKLIPVMKMKRERFAHEIPELALAEGALA